MKAVLFDLGHTLISYHNDWREPEKRAVTEVARRVDAASPQGVDWEEVARYLLELLEQGRKLKLEKHVEIPLTDVLDKCFKRYGVSGDDELMQQSLEEFYAVLLEHREEIPGTQEMLQFVKDSGYSIGLVSDVAWGLPSYFPQRDMRHYRLDQYFDDMVFSTDVGLRKPHPKIFKIALSNLGASASEAIFVGNNLQADILGALNVGMTAILKESNFYTHDDDITPHAKISNWDEFLDLLRKKGP
ncbi:MAG: HAD family hydrolase [Methanomassiliicoccales archaeon]